MSTRGKPALRAKQLLRRLDDTATLKMLETIAETVDVSIAPFMKAGHAVTFSLNEDDVSLSLRSLELPRAL